MGLMTAEGISIEKELELLTYLLSKELAIIPKAKGNSDKGTKIITSQENSSSITVMNSFT